MVCSTGSLLSSKPWGLVGAVECCAGANSAKTNPPGPQVRCRHPQSQAIHPLPGINRHRPDPWIDGWLPPHHPPDTVHLQHPSSFFSDPFQASPGWVRKTRPKTRETHRRCTAPRLLEYRRLRLSLPSSSLSFPLLPFACFLTVAHSTLAVPFTG